jgi:hypothetical protein
MGLQVASGRALPQRTAVLDASELQAGSTSDMESADRARSTVDAEMSSHVRLVCLPTRDIGFAERVDEVMALMPAVNEPAELQDALRDTYPKVIVRPSELEGLRTPTWYVYRDGHFPWPE